MKAKEATEQERLRRLRSFDASREQKHQAERPGCAYEQVAMVRHAQAPLRSREKVQVGEERGA